MERNWDIKAWNPAIVQEGSGLQCVQVLQRILISYSRQVTDVPYFPSAWALRTNTLKFLGYPELAVRDAYKSIIFYNFGVRYDSETGLKVWLMDGMCLMLEDPEALELLAVTASAEEAQRRIKLELYPDNMALPRMLTSLQQQATFIENELKEGGHSEAEVEKINAVK